jgi:hypothetical protein
MMMMQYMNMANMQMQNQGMMGQQGGIPFGGGPYYGQSGMNPMLLQTMNAHPPVFKAPYTAGQPLSKEDKRNAEVLNLQSKVVYLVPE